MKDIMYQDKPGLMIGTTIISVIIILLALYKYKNKIKGYIFIYLGVQTLISMTTNNLIIPLAIGLIALIPYKIYNDKNK